MQFYQPEFSVAFWILPVLVLVLMWASRLKRTRLGRFGVLPTVERIGSFSPPRWRGRAIVMLLAVCLALVALLRPQWGAEKKKLERKGLDILFLFDTSLSMLAEDVKPSRIEKAKLEMKSFVKKLKGDRVGLIAFSGSSFLQCPLTLDYAAFFLFLDAVTVGYIPDPGSSLREGLENALRSFPKEEKKYKSVVIFSDGEIHEGMLPSLAKKASEEGVTVYAVGMGTKVGEPIPLKDQTGKIAGYKKDRAGQVVVSKLEEEVLRAIAAETGGLYFAVTPGEREIELIHQDMKKLGKKEFKKQLVVEREEHYQLFLLTSLVFLFLHGLISERVRPREVV
jgi:Ca-activated chloride channel family protein